MLQTRTASFICQNVPSWLKNLLEWERRILIGHYRIFIATLGSRFTGVRRLPLHPMVNYEYLILCPYLWGISQLDSWFLCRSLTEYSKLRDFLEQRPSIPQRRFREWTSTVIFMTTRTRNVFTSLSRHSVVYGWLRTGRNWGLSIVLPYKQISNIIFGCSMHDRIRICFKCWRHHKEHLRYVRKLFERST
jgi:hypothetical protein